jgi:hypothetical protein
MAAKVEKTSQLLWSVSRIPGNLLAPLEKHFQEESAETANSSSCAEYHFVVLNPVWRMRKRKPFQHRLIGFAVAWAYAVTCTLAHAAAVPHTQLHHDFTDPAA